MGEKPSLQTLVVYGMAHPRRTVVHLYAHLARFEELDMVIGHLLAGYDVVDVTDDLVVATLYPDVNVTGGAHIGGGVEQGIALAL